MQIAEEVPSPPSFFLPTTNVCPSANGVVSGTTTSSGWVGDGRRPPRQDATVPVLSSSHLWHILGGYVGLVMVRLVYLAHTPLKWSLVGDWQCNLYKDGMNNGYNA
eukprot:scaffold2363_cov159-Amphora_coffeaeformis.AAC.47